MTRADFEKLDREDQLASFRQEFKIPQGVIYMDGNSLGAMPKAVLPMPGGPDNRGVNGKSRSSTTNQQANS